MFQLFQSLLYPFLYTISRCKYRHIFSHTNYFLIFYDCFPTPHNKKIFSEFYSRYKKKMG